MTHRGDFHALLIKKLLSDRYNAWCWIIEADTIHNNAVLSWSPNHSVLPTSEDEPLDVSSLDLIWCRRFCAEQTIAQKTFNEAEVSLINNDCETSLLGILATEFKGIWISDPEATLRAENKLIQLKTAASTGFRIPRTLISQNPSTIKNFYSEFNGKVIIKPVRGTRRQPLFTNQLTETHLADEDSMKVSPAIYQEMIEGSTHVRTHCFGKEVYSLVIKSNHLDWRRDRRFAMSPTHLEESVRRKLLDVVARLGLRMGIIDLKFDLNKEVVWLELNPQGQFLFSEAIGGVDLKTAFTDFIYQEAAAQ